MKSLFRFASFASALALLACSGGGSSTSGTTTLPITVATGAPVEGASVTVVDSRGSAETCASTTNSSGVVNCALSNTMTAPYFIQATKLTTTLYAVLPDTASRVNVTPISTAMAKKFASDNGVEPEKIVGQPSIMTSTSKASAQAAVELVNAIIKVIALQTAGISIDNALTQSYTAATTDNLDKVIQNMNITTDSSGVTITVPTATGTMNVNVAFTATKQAAESAVTSNVQGVTANLDDGARIEQTLDTFISLLGACNAQNKTTLLGMIEARSYTVNGSTVKYMEGRTVSDWVDRVCSEDFGTLKRTYVRSLARYGNKVVMILGLKSTGGNEFDFPIAMIKVGSTWKLLSDNMPVNQGVTTVHELRVQYVESAGTEKFFYKRFLNAWIDDKITYQLQPDRIEIFAIPLKEVNDKWKPSAFGQLSPIFTIYKANQNADPCGDQKYTIDANRQACNNQASDSTIPAVFTMLENNDFTHIVFKLLDSSGACLNCDSFGVPESGALIGKAYPFRAIFGTSVTSSQLESGLDRSKLPTAAISSYRSYFAAPVEADLTALSKLLLSNSSATKVRIPWTRATKNKSQVDSSWGGYQVCSQGSTWTNFQDDLSLSFNSPDYWDVTFPSPARTFNQYSYMSFNIANRFYQSEFSYLISVNRNCAT